ncbi:hypothetical protein BX616_009329 [Lobosporangium transversale]|nr:hypothetical protein BX616_009329 [Lobosporangium transversale]
MRSKNWEAQECAYEADVANASVCSTSDIVMSVDNDILAYGNITTARRPVSRHKSFIYHVPTMLSQLNISKGQLAALCIVSKNDYNCNIARMGLKTNFKVIKSLQAEDPKESVKHHLNHPDVTSKNETYERFTTAIKVFINRRQRSQAA